MRDSRHVPTSCPPLAARRRAETRCLATKPPRAKLLSDPREESYHRQRPRHEARARGHIGPALPRADKIPDRRWKPNPLGAHVRRPRGGSRGQPRDSQRIYRVLTPAKLGDNITALRFFVALYFWKILHL